MELNDYKEKLDEIQKAVAGLDEPLKSKAIDQLLEIAFNTGAKDKSNKKEKKERTPRVKKIQAKRSENIKEDEIADKEIMATINKTEHPEIHKLKTNLDRALFVLGIMKQKNYDGLNPSQIRTILSDVFRIKSNLAAISMALINDKYYTEKDTVSYKGGRANKYRIMQTGEDYVKKKLSEVNNHTGPTAEEPTPNLSSEVSRDNSEVAH